MEGRRSQPAVLALYSVLLLIGAVLADSCSDEVLNCYTCNSLDDPRCSSPFNYTDRPPVHPCNGWCVKIVEDIDTEFEKVLRTCTDKMHINPFIVGNVCMEESSGHGTLCFCKKPYCNSSVRNGLVSALLSLAAVSLHLLA